MKLILGVDAIAPPLTGIGRYAFELARGLARHPAVTDLRYFGFGHWVADPTRGIMDAATPAPRAASRLRTRLAASRLATRTYQRLTPSLYRWRLRRCGEALFHSPNFLLPPFPGRAVATIHDLSFILHPKYHPSVRVEFMQRALPASLRHATHLIVDANTIKHEVVHHLGWPAERISTVALAADPAFRPRPTAEITPALKRHRLQPGSYSLCVATIEPRKNIDRLLDAYGALPAVLRQRHPLVLAGGRGWNSAHLHQRIAQGTASGWLHYLDYVAEADLPLLYAGARLFVYPSLYEGFGLPVLEAMSSGLPVITSSAASLPEVAGGAALLIDPLDTDALRAALARGLDDEDWRSTAATASLARASQFSWQRCVDETVAVYRQVLEQA
ncbi:glycosyltransferase family 4 protein [Aromatoleum aromaticum]|uniref:glycosyltransferase family 4 protein n=1 Tax=Aromatoleum aromaticum TaxID=551760 RepID=UPI00145959F6|nr:glycosyltransferase family 1 protein [Aromatoleum aromaticum]NMG56409.1 glycosyltransferase [Aromatoleum aromaticum]